MNFEGDPEQVRDVSHLLNPRNWHDLPEIHFGVPAHKCGLVIGKGGHAIKKIKETSGAHVSLCASPPSSRDKKLFLIKGQPHQIEFAKELIKSRIGGVGNSIQLAKPQIYQRLTPQFPLHQFQQVSTQLYPSLGYANTYQLRNGQIATATGSTTKKFLPRDRMVQVPSTEEQNHLAPSFNMKRLEGSNKKNQKELKWDFREFENKIFIDKNTIYDYCTRITVLDTVKMKDLKPEEVDSARKPLSEDNSTKKNILQPQSSSSLKNTKSCSSKTELKSKASYKLSKVIHQSSYCSSQNIDFHKSQQASSNVKHNIPRPPPPPSADLVVTDTTSLSPDDESFSGESNEEGSSVVESADLNEILDSFLYSSSSSEFLGFCSSPEKNEGSSDISVSSVHTSDLSSYEEL